ncbi:hypothetical protein MMPV_001989 [Pyropia vietnamensis]
MCGECGGVPPWAPEAPNQEVGAAILAAVNAAAAASPTAAALRAAAQASLSASVVTPPSLLPVVDDPSNDTAAAAPGVDDADDEADEWVATFDDDADGGGGEAMVATANGVAVDGFVADTTTSSLPRPDRSVSPPFLASPPGEPSPAARSPVRAGSTTSAAVDGRVRPLRRRSRPPAAPCSDLDTDDGSSVGRGGSPLGGRADGGSGDDVSSTSGYATPAAVSSADGGGPVDSGGDADDGDGVRGVRAGSGNRVGVRSALSSVSLTSPLPLALRDRDLPGGDGGGRSDGLPPDEEDSYSFLPRAGSAAAGPGAAPQSSSDGEGSLELHVDRRRPPLRARSPAEAAAATAAPSAAAAAAAGAAPSATVAAGAATAPPPPPPDLALRASVGRDDDGGGAPGGRARLSPLPQSPLAPLSPASLPPAPLSAAPIPSSDSVVDIPLSRPCPTCAAAAERVAELEARLAAATAALAAREAADARRRAADADAAAGMGGAGGGGSRQRLREQVTSLQMTVEFLFRKLSEGEEAGRSQRTGGGGGGGGGRR